MNHPVNSYHYFSCRTGRNPSRLALKRVAGGQIMIFKDQDYHPLTQEDAKALGEWLLDEGPMAPGDTVQHNIFGQVRIVALDDRGFAWVTPVLHGAYPKEGVLVDVKNLSRS